MEINKKNVLKLNLVLMGLLTSILIIGSGVAQALPVNVRSIPVLDGPETPLQMVLDNITVGGPGISVATDQSNAALFTNNASGGAVATFIIELAGNASTNTFGIYSDGDVTNRAQIFSGASTGGSQALVSFLLNGDIEVNGSNVATGFGSDFGFYLGLGNNSFFYSEDDENGGNAQAVIFQGDGETSLQIGMLASGIFDPSEFIIAFEDITLPSSDSDYNDLVVLVESVTPVPEPASLILLGSGLLGLGFFGMKKKES